MNVNFLFNKSIRIRSQLVNYQTVRWRRPKKPFWLGIAKSKMFIIPEPRRALTPEERLQGSSLLRHYRTHYKSLMNFIKVDNPRLKISEVQTNKVAQSELEKEIAKSLQVNEEWNKESARRREERMQQNKVVEIEKAIKELDVHEEKRMRQMEIIEEIVRKEKQLSASYITPENLDEAVENCLNKIDCFDFAIDLEGNKYHGRESLSPSQLDKTSTEVQVENQA